MDNQNKQELFNIGILDAFDSGHPIEISVDKGKTWQDVNWEVNRTNSEILEQELKDGVHFFRIKTVQKTYYLKDIEYIPYTCAESFLVDMKENGPYILNKNEEYIFPLYIDDSGILTFVKKTDAIHYEFSFINISFYELSTNDYCWQNGKKCATIKK